MDPFPSTYTNCEEHEHGDCSMGYAPIKKCTPIKTAEINRTACFVLTSISS
jgi:hypothetical protein